MARPGVDSSSPNGPESGKPVFDSFSHDYDDALMAGLVYSGENPSFFARGRIAWLARCVRALSFRPRILLDYGCGKASSTPFFFELLDVERLIGVDVSSGLLKIARDREGSDRAQFRLRKEAFPAQEADLAFCNGVFHHIPPADRAGELAFIRDNLESGGFFALWENNPWNPATRFVMSRVAFDADAETLSVLETKRLVRAAGFEVLRTDFLFIFPRALRWFRGLEPPLSRIPLGTQYQVLCRKPL